jgi:hypothetical protein
VVKKSLFDSSASLFGRTQSSNAHATKPYLSAWLCRETRVWFCV